MVGEVFAGLSALKTAFDLAKGLKDIDDATRRNAAGHRTARKNPRCTEAQSALLDRVGELEEEMAHLETWKREKERYERKTLGMGCFRVHAEESGTRNRTTSLGLHKLL